MSDVDVANSADPPSGTQVAPGGAVTYTLAFTNASTEAPATVDHTDHMAGVLDDATMTAGPTVSDPSLSAAVAGDTIRITGELAEGQRVTVAYTVTLEPYDEQGDHALRNMVAATGDEPVCAPGSPVCTVHAAGGSGPPPPRVGPLPVTGTTVSFAALVLAALGTAIGLGLLGASRRRQRTTS